MTNVCPRSWSERHPSSPHGLVLGLVVASNLGAEVAYTFLCWPRLAGLRSEWTFRRSSSELPSNGDGSHGWCKPTPLPRLLQRGRSTRSWPCSSIPTSMIGLARLRKPLEWCGRVVAFCAWVPPRLYPGYRQTERTHVGPGLGEGLRRRVGVRHVPLAAFLNALLEPGLQLERVEEPGPEDYPRILAVAAVRR
jgi:hypothetical protein